MLCVWKKSFFVAIAIETAATSLKARLHQTRRDLFRYWQLLLCARSGLWWSSSLKPPTHRAPAIVRQVNGRHNNKINSPVRVSLAEFTISDNNLSSERPKTHLRVQCSVRISFGSWTRGYERSLGRSETATLLIHCRDRFRMAIEAFTNGLYSRGSRTCIWQRPSTFIASEWPSSSLAVQLEVWYQICTRCAHAINSNWREWLFDQHSDPFAALHHFGLNCRFEFSREPTDTLENPSSWSRQKTCSRRCSPRKNPEWN